MRKINYLLVNIIFLLLGSVLTARAQQSTLDSLNKKFTRHREMSVQEKIYVHIDRSLYMTGETMWFKVYYVDGTLHHPVDLSKVCYVEILDLDNQPVLQTKVAINKSGGSGSVFIPATINSGNFTVRAYTNWMKNFSPEFYFSSTISIINPFRTPDYLKSPVAKQPDAQFFPEGGNLVAGIQSKVAFRVANELGKGISFKGSLLNQNNDTLATFKPLKFGIGHFLMTPQSGQSYRAVIRDENGKTYSYNLPKPQDQGYGLQISDDQQVTIKVTSNLADVNYVYIFVHARQIIAKAQVVFIKNGTASVVLDKADLQEGISHITVFDETLHPISERLYFKRPVKKLTVDVKSDQLEYDLRRKGNIELEAKNTTGAPANFSVAIYKLDSIAAPNQENIESYFWLSSDLKFGIESPEYYLTDNDSATIAADNLMLTHGWSRFLWKDVLEKKPVISFTPEFRGHVIHGEVLSQEGALADGIQTYLSSPGKLVRLYGSRSTVGGKTFYEMQDFYGPHKIVVQTNRTKDSVYTPRIVSPFSNQFAKTTLPIFKLSTKAEDELTSKTIGMQVQDVYSDESSIRIINPIRDSTAFYGKADETYLLDAYTRFPVMEEVMREYVPGVLVRKRRDGFHFLVLDRVRGSVLRDNPMVLLDGIPIFDEDEIMAFDPLKIKKLEVLTRQYYVGAMVLQGIVSYSTYRGDLAGFQLNPKAISIDYEGLQANREFFSPVYEDKKSRGSRLPDQRSLIYWAPDIKLASGQKQSVSFYTSDRKGKYTVVVKGLSEDGSPASATTSFQIRRFDY